MLDSMSNWDTCCWDERGNCSNGITEASPAGARIEVCRNWLNVVDEKSWRTGCLFPNPITATISDGEISYLDWTVIAAPADTNDGIIFAAWYKDADGGMRGMVGVTVDGFDPGRISRDRAYVGVRKVNVDHLRRMLDEWRIQRRIPESLAKHNIQEPLRFNQGDAVVARGSNKKLEATVIGEALMPMALEFLEKTLAEANPEANGEVQKNTVPTPE